MSFFKFVFIYLFVFLSPFSVLFAQNMNPIILEKESDLLLIGQKIEFLEDKENKLDIEAILKAENQAKFQKGTKDVFARPASKSVFWFKILVQNKTKKEAWLEVGTTFVWYINFYVPFEKTYILQNQTGSLRPENTKAFPSNLFWFPLPQTPENQPVYLRIETLRTLDLPLYVGTLSSLSKHKSNTDFIAAAFVGLMSIMILYYLFVFFVLRDRVYLWYVGYLLFALNLFTFLNHYPFITHILGEKAGFWLHSQTHIWGPSINVLIGFFGIRFLDLNRKAPKIAIYIKILVFIAAFVIPFGSALKVIPHFILSNLNFYLILYFSLFGTGIYLWLFKKEKNARFYVIAWVWMISASYSFVFVSNGFLPYNYISRNASFFGVSLEVLFFSLALADRINVLRREKDFAQLQNIQLIKEQNIILEQKVSLRTQEIQQQKEEIETQSEELQQANNALLLTYSELEEKNKDIQDSINASLRIQNALLPLTSQIESSLGKDNYFLLFKPRDVVSGDFYWFSEVENTKIIIVTDCTGHGVPGALMSMIGMQLLDKIVNENRVLEPHKILQLLHLELIKLLKQKETLLREGMDISAISISSSLHLLPIGAGNVLSYAGAMNPLYLVQNNELVDIKADKKSIGGSEGYRNFSNHTFQITSQTTLYLFTDGFQDQFGGAQNRKFMTKQFRELLFSISQKPMSEQGQILNKTIEKWIIEGNETQTDDITVMGIRI